MSDSTPNRLADLRHERGLSQNALARLADTTVFTISRIEGGGTPRIPTARRIAAALEVSLDDIWPEVAA